MQSQGRDNALRLTNLFGGDLLSIFNSSKNNLQAEKKENIDAWQPTLDASKRLEKIGAKVFQATSKDNSNFRLSINTKNLSQKTGIKKESNAVLLGKALEHFESFATCLSMVGDEGAKAFVQINEEKATVHFLANTDDLSS